MNKTLFFLLVSVLMLFSVKSFSQGKNKSEGSTVYDMVDPKTMEIDGDFYMESYKANANAKVKKIDVNVQADAKFFNAPNLTFRYGLGKNLEMQVITGYTGVLTNGNVVIRTKKNIAISVNKNVTGLDALGLGLKVGLFSNKGSRPSAAITGIMTLPNVGVPLFAPNNVGSEFDLDLYNELSDDFDLQYGAGIVWTGFNEDAHPSYLYGITPGLNLSDFAGLYLDLNGSLEKGVSTDNRIDLDLSFALNDNITLDVYAGTSFNIKKFYFIGSSFTATIPF